MYSSSDTPIYTFDRTKRLIVFAIVAAIAVLIEIYFTLTDNLPLYGNNGNDGMLYILLVTGSFSAGSVYSFVKSERIEFYGSFLRAINKIGTMSEIPYSELYLSPLYQRQGFRLAQIKDNAEVRHWNLQNPTIWKPDGESIMLYGLLVSKTKANPEIPGAYAKFARRQGMLLRISYGLLAVGIAAIAGGFYFVSLSGINSSIYATLFAVGSTIIIFGTTGIIATRKVKTRIDRAIAAKNAAELGAPQGLAKNKIRPELQDQWFKPIAPLDSTKIRRFAFFGILGSFSIIVGSLFLYLLLPNQNPGVDQYLELYSTAIVGFGAISIASLYLRSASKNLPSDVRMTLSRGASTTSHRGFSILAALSVFTMGFVVVGIFLIPYGMFSSSTSTLSFYSVFFSFFSFVIVFILFLSTLVGYTTFLRAIGKQRRRIMVVTAVVICVALLTPFASVFYQTALAASTGPNYNVRIDFTTTYLTINYPNAGGSGYLGASKQTIHWTGSATAPGKDKFNATLTLSYDKFYNESGHMITAFNSTDQGFSIISVAPTIPFTAAGNELNISYVLLTPDFNYTGPLDLYITTT